MTAVVGIDPGGRYVGLVVREGEELIRAEVLDRRKLEAAGVILADEPTAWALQVVGRILAIELRADVAELAGRAPVVAVEGVRAPSPHVRRRDGNALTNVTGLLDTAIVLGAIVARFPSAIVVPPAANGAGPDLAYPPGIRSGTRGLGGPPVHARSAWDVAGSAPYFARVRAATIPARSRGNVPETQEV